MVSSKKGKISTAKVPGRDMPPFVEDVHEREEDQEVQEGIERKGILLF